MSSFFGLGAKERVGKQNQLMKLAQVIDWSALSPHLKGLYRYENNGQGGS